jgi:adenylosuccinate synthase
MLNGVTELVVTKIDVLNSFETINACQQYDYNGTFIDYLPFENEENLLKPVYVQKNGWNRNLNEISTYNQFPENLKAYIQYIEEIVKVPVSIISNGPDRTQTIFRER